MFIVAISGDDQFGISSPAIDAGGSIWVPVEADPDLAGNPRIVDAINYADIGVPDGVGNVVAIGVYEALASIAGPCIGELNVDSAGDVTDLLELIGAWGLCMDCSVDFNGDNEVDECDLRDLIGAWGVCPYNNLKFIGIENYYNMKW